MKKSLPCGLICAALLILLPACPAFAARSPEYAIWAGLLERHVHHGVVDYSGLQAEQAKLDKFLDSMALVDIGSLDPQAQKAMYINAYNAWTIKLILSKYPDIESIKDLGGLFTTPWEIELVRLGGRVLTLDYIEHKILRPVFKDPRVHFAVNCASKSCPPLLGEPYLPQTLDAQLDQVTTAFINDPNQTYIKDRVLYLSKIFSWFADDFGDDPAGFVLKYAKDGFNQELKGIYPGVKITYLDYDWSLNGQ